MKSLESQSVSALLKAVPVGCKSATAPQPGCYNIAKVGFGRKPGSGHRARLSAFGFLPS